MSLLTEEHMKLLNEIGKIYDRVDSEKATDEEEMDFPIAARLHLPGTGMSWVLSYMCPDVPGLLFGASCSSYGCPRAGFFDLAELEALRTSDGRGPEVDQFAPEDSLLDFLVGEVVQSDLRLAQRLVQQKTKPS